MQLPPMRLVIPRLLAELSQAPGSGSTLDPMLVITPTQVMVNGTVLVSAEDRHTHTHTRTH